MINVAESMWIFLDAFPIKWKWLCDDVLVRFVTCAITTKSAENKEKKKVQTIGMEAKKTRHNPTYIECLMSTDMISIFSYGENNKNEREFVQYLLLQNGLNTYGSVFHFSSYIYTHTHMQPHGVQSSLMVLCALLSGQSEGQTVT